MPSTNVVDTRRTVQSGRQTWLQVYETLINAGTSPYTRRQFLEPKLDVGASVDVMPASLFATGEVPLVWKSA